MVFCEVLRIGHRPERDKRITTHVALTARAFGARGITFHKGDSRILETVSNVTDKFGGDFEVKSTSNPKGKCKSNIKDVVLMSSLNACSVVIQIPNPVEPYGVVIFV